MLTLAEGSPFCVSKPAFQKIELKIYSAVGYALQRVSVNNVVRKTIMFSNRIVDITISCRSRMVSTSLSEVGGLTVRALDLVNH